MSGPGNCLGVLAAKTGPTAVRGQYYGLAAAIGKVGAFIGTWGSLHSCLDRFLTDGCLTVFPLIIDGELGILNLSAY